MKTKWYWEFENFDETGEKVYWCNIPMSEEVMPRLFSLCYFPSEQKAWFWPMYSDNVIRVANLSWEGAEQLKAILNSGRKNHFMDAGSIETAEKRNVYPH